MKGIQPESYLGARFQHFTNILKEKEVHYRSELSKYY
jgi:hypothetical protein